MNAAIILANGFEEIEATAPFDILKRGGVNVSFVGLENENVSGAHGIKITADTTLKNYDFNSCDMVILPGGLPGAQFLADSTALLDILKTQAAANKYCAAICAAPMVLARAGLINGEYTCYPGFEANVSTNPPSSKKVVISGKIITSRGPGTAVDFGLVLLEILKGKAVSNEVAAAMLLA